MKRLWWGVLAFIISVNLTIPVGALDTAPTTPNKIAGPFIITGYSFSGSSLRYVQIYNNSSMLSSLDGWRIASTSKLAPVTVTNYISMSGQLEPGKHVIAAAPGLIDHTIFTLPAGPSGNTANVGSVSLIAPFASGLNDETAVVPTIGSSSSKEAEGSYLNYYVRRDVSGVTGNYVSGYSLFVPTDALRTDQLYVPPAFAQLQVAEIYPDAAACKPYDVSPLCMDYVKLYNPTSVPIDMTHYRLRTGAYGQAASASNARPLTGSLAAGHYINVPISLSASGSWIWIEDLYGGVHYQNTMIEYPSANGHENQAWAYDAEAGEWRWTSIPTPTDAPSQFPAPPIVNACSELRISEIAANVADEDQFFELYNPTPMAIDTVGCVVMTNRSSDRYLLSEPAMPAFGRVVIYIKDTGLTLTKTTSGTMYVLSSDDKTEVQQVAYADLKEGTSWAEMNGTWSQTYVPTPGAENQLQSYAPCAAGYVRSSESGNCGKSVVVSDVSLTDCGPGKYRSPDTNRCRSLEALVTALTPCDIGQYRNPETNRCRSLLSTTSSLTPCAAGQERNPDTNRCRSITSDGGLTPCTENQERNPETNRCRNKAIAPTADFPVEAIAQTGEATLGWWAFGGVGTLAAGYAGWEWRREVSGWIRSRLPFGIDKP